MSAMQAEAFSYGQYVLFAERARKNNQPELADLFEKTTHVEHFEHLAQEVELAGLAGSVFVHQDQQPSQTAMGT